MSSSPLVPNSCGRSLKFMQTSWQNRNLDTIKSKSAFIFSHKTHFILKELVNFLSNHRPFRLTETSLQAETLLPKMRFFSTPYYICVHVSLPICTSLPGSPIITSRDCNQSKAAILIAFLKWSLWKNATLQVF